jgi:hypothetical protein
MRWTENKLVCFALLFVSLHCADKKMRNRALKLAKKIKIKEEV